MSAVLVAGALAAAAQAAPGDLDPSFDADGKVTTGIGQASALNDQANDTAIQGDGKIIVVGDSQRPDPEANFVFSDFALARYNADGTLDTSFGGDGSVATGFTPVSHDVANAVAIQGDGKIVVVGESGGDFAVARYNPNGTLDSGFDGDGKLTTDLGAEGSVANGVAIQVDGKIVAAGQANIGVVNQEYNAEFALARYNANGSLDTGFDGDGKAVTDFGGFDGALSLAIQADGKIAAAGHAGSAMAVARYDVNGALDAGFDGDGKLATNFGNSFTRAAIAIQADGKLVLAGESGSVSAGNLDFALARYNTDGSPDNGFSGDGKLTTDFNVGPGSPDGASDVAIQADGKIVAGGFAAGGDVGLARYNASGTLDAGFDGDGLVWINGVPSISGMAIQSDAKIVAAGVSTDGSDFDFALARYNTGGTLDTGFDQDGLQSTDIDVPSLEAIKDVAIQSDGKLVVAGYTDVGDGDLDFAVARYNANGGLDTSFDGDGIAITAFGTTGGFGDPSEDRIEAVKVQTDGKIVVAGTSDASATGFSDEEFALARYNANGSPDTSFDGDGRVTTDFAGRSFDHGADLAIQGDGRLVVVGQSRAGTGNDDFALARYNAGGGLDTSFSGDGKLTTPSGGNDRARAVAIQTDGKVVAAGVAGGSFALARYDTNGSLEASEETVFSAGSSSANDLAIQADGKLVVVGRVSVSTIFEPVRHQFAIARYKPDVTLDTGFDGDGRVTAAIGANTRDEAFGVAVQPNGKVIAVGRSGDLAGQDAPIPGFDALPVVSDFAITRYNANGSLDASFDGDGKLTTDFAAGSNDGANAVALQADGKIVAAGASSGDLAAARYTGGVGSQPLTVTKAGAGSGTVTSSPAGIDCGPTCAAQFPEGQVVTLTASKTAGSEFASWSGCQSSSGSQCTVTMDATRAVTATFNVAPPRVLTVFSQGGGSGTISSSDGNIACFPTCSHSYADGAQVTLTATPASGSTFTGWGIDCAGVGVCVLSMDSDKFATATFSSIQTSPPVVTQPPFPSTEPSATCKKKKGKKKRGKKKKCK